MDQIPRRKTDSDHRFNIAPNLLQQDFGASQPNQKWAGDITYVWTREGWVYLAVILDLHSRRVIGWAISNRLKCTSIFLTFRCRSSVRPFEVGTGLLICGLVGGFVSAVRPSGRDPRRFAA